MVGLNFQQETAIVTRESREGEREGGRVVEINWKIVVFPRFELFYAPSILLQKKIS